MADDPTYIHGTSAAEQARLELMNELLNERELATLGVESGARVLEMGAGTGIFASALARSVGPTGHVLAVERDPAQMEAARARAEDARAPFELRRGSVYEPPLTDAEWGSFDWVHARFLLEHLARPADAVRVLVRAVRPGGHIALVDDDHALMRFWPDPGGMAELWSDYADHYASLGLVPDVGRRLVSFLVEAGARPVRTTQIDYGGCAGEPHFGGIVRNLSEVVGTAREGLLAGGKWTAARFDGALEAFQSWSQRPDASVWYALPCAIATRGARA